MKNRNGNGKGTSAIGKDMTERMTLEQYPENKAKEFEEKYTALLENLRDGYFLIQDKKFVCGNRILEDILESPLDEIIGQDITKRIQSESLLKAIEEYHIMPEKGPLEAQYEIIKKDGSYIQVETRLNRTYYGGNPALIGIIRDRTERVKIEETLLRTNRELIEYKNILEDTTAAMDVRSEYITDLNQKMEIALSEVEEKNRELEEAKGRIVQQEKMASIGQLSAGIAHEINNPIGFINSNLGTISEYIQDITGLLKKYGELKNVLKDFTEEKTRSLCDEIIDYENGIGIEFILEDFEKAINESKEGTERVKKIVKDLKDFSHVGEAELKYADINQGLETTLNIVWNEVKYNATVTKDYGDIPKLKCYPQQLNQVFMNILINAAQALTSNGEIGIKTYNGDGNVYVQISDTGQGIPEENMIKLFDPFFTSKEVGKGTGLGLSIAYGIVQKHGGKIHVESEVGKGSTFTIELPLEANHGS